ncbi:hypothetical protein I4U23_004463 [Adineta vaga]|nr:hypothetical protein I4U23_004463 [Adineta vaga]
MLVLSNLFQIVPNLCHLTLKAHDFNIDGYQWEHLIVNYLPKLQVFCLEIESTILSDDDDDDKTVQSFQTPFWLEEHQ